MLLCFTVTVHVGLASLPVRVPAFEHTTGLLN
jgi:hypothetical protein